MVGIRWARLVFALSFTACGGAGEAAYLNTRAGGDLAALTQDADPERPSAPSGGLGEMRLRPAVCQGLDLQPEHARIGPGELVAFLRAQGGAPEVQAARSDLTYVDLPVAGGKVRLRVATLPSSDAAARDLHEALLEHGAGAWGVHRSNVAVLAPIGDLAEVIRVAALTKLPCWGTLTVAGRDDVFVVPGGYREL